MFTLDLPQQPIEFNISLVQYHLTKQFILLSSGLFLSCLNYIPEKVFSAQPARFNQKNMASSGNDRHADTPTLIPPSTPTMAAIETEISILVSSKMASSSAQYSAHATKNRVGRSEGGELRS